MTFPITQADFYKLSHKKFMHESTEFLYANFTPRSAKYAKWLDNSDQKTVFFGLQHFIQDFLIDEFNKDFFEKSKETVIIKLKRRCDAALGPDAISMEHFEALHDLGYLPICIKALDEGLRVPFKVPMLTIFNTHKDFAWLVTYLETVMSCELWQPITSATTAFEYRKLCEKYAALTVGNNLHVPFQCHDFSFRGMAGRHAAAISGAAHLLSFTGTDTASAIDLLEDFYGANVDVEFIAGSVPASEHSVTSLGSSVDGEFDTIKKWITQDYPTGIVSVVSDTYDYWRVLTEYLPILKQDILSRKKNALGLSKVVVRPDSGNPVHIICGYKIIEENILWNTPLYVISDEEYEIVHTNTGKYHLLKESYDSYGYIDQRTLGEEISEAEALGSIEMLWNIFGGTISNNGYKVIDSHIGLIYGDSITLDRAKEIFERLETKGFASSNVVLGVGSFTYQMVSRDTLGMAMKATYAVVDNAPRNLFKDPVTDDGTKKSARGLLHVSVDENGEFKLLDETTPLEESTGCLQIVFKDGKLYKMHTLKEMRERLSSYL